MTVYVLLEKAWSSAVENSTDVVHVYSTYEKALEEKNKRESEPYYNSDWIEYSIHEEKLL